MATMTFEEFQATRQPCDNLGQALQDECLMGSAGYLYGCPSCGGLRLYVEDASRWPADAPGYGKGHWFTQVGRAEYQSDDLTEVERPLYDFAVSEGYC